METVSGKCKKKNNNRLKRNKSVYCSLKFTETDGEKLDRKLPGNIFLNSLIANALQGGRKIALG